MGIVCLDDVPSGRRRFEDICADAVDKGDLCNTELFYKEFDVGGVLYGSAVGVERLNRDGRGVNLVYSNLLFIG